MDAEKPNRMKSAEEILSHLSEIIAAMHHRPKMYAGSATDPGAAQILDSLMFQAHHIWGHIQDRDFELVDAVHTVSTKFDFGSRNFFSGYRYQHPAAPEAEVFEFVRACWAEVSSRLGIDLTDPNQLR